MQSSAGGGRCPLIREVLHFPQPILKQRSAPIDSLDDDTRALAVDLVETMRAYPHCVGLAAPQIGISLRAMTVDVSNHPKAATSHGLVVLFNPEIIEGGSSEPGREGCMSVPDLTGDVARAKSLTMRGLNLDGDESILEVEGFEARAFQHEIDHLDGLLFLDRVRSHTAIFRRK